MTTPSKLDSFQVPWSMHVLSGLVNRFPRLWIKLGDLESSAMRSRLDSTEIDRPIYISGIARAGTTMLLELLSRHSEVATHKYRDFPGLFVPTWWERGHKPGQSAPQERAHGDLIQVTQDSPEAMEECIWMAFFPGAHQPDVSGVLNENTRHPDFEQFYRDHLRKLLIIRDRSRYVAKGNYNLTRLSYLQKLHPSARFVIALRQPRDHIASLMRQHRLFCAGAMEYPRALAQLRRVGHFEFGLDRRAINTGDDRALEVMELWRQGEEVRGCARYWAQLYGWLVDELARNSALGSATRIVQYEDFCEHPQRELEELLQHCQLSPEAALEEYATQIQSRHYYKSDFSAEDEAIIREETEAVYQKLQPACC